MKSIKRSYPRSPVSQVIKEQPVSLGSRQFKYRIQTHSRTTHGCWLAAVLCLTSGCGVLSMGGTDGESSFLDGKHRTIRSETEDAPDASPEHTSETDANPTTATDSPSESDSSDISPSGTSAVAPTPPAEPIYVGSWTSAVAPEACVANLSNPIAGCDPDVDDEWPLDCDSDGTPDHFALECDPTNTQNGWYTFYGEYDCAPDDPSRAIWIAPDMDADGYLGNGEFNCSSPTLPAGYEPNLGDGVQDCDDSEANIHPDAAEIWGDGTDSDCNGADYPNCETIEDPNLPIATQEIRTCTTGSDLHFLEPAFCGERCRTEGTFYFIVVNSGEVASPSDLRITYSDDTGASGETLLQAIEPGAASVVVPVTFYHATEVTVTIEHDDCSTEDNTLVMTAGGDKVCLF